MTTITVAPAAAAMLARLDADAARAIERAQLALSVLTAGMGLDGQRLVSCDTTTGNLVFEYGTNAD